MKRLRIVALFGVLLIASRCEDSSGMRYVQISFQTGAEIGSQDLWEGIPASYFFRTGPRGFLMAFPVSGNQVLAYVPYGGSLPSLPDSGGTGTRMASACRPILRPVSLLHRNPGDRRLCGRGP